MLLAANVLVLLAAAPASAQPVTFNAATSLPAGDAPSSVAVGDFNGDSDPDLAVADSGNPFGAEQGNVSILLGDGSGSFTGPTNFAAGSHPRSVAVGDFNGDSDPDLAVANEFSNGVSILLGAAGGSFTGPTNFPAGSRPFSVAVGDFNGDSDPDLAVASLGSNDVSILLGAGGGGFTGPTAFAAGGEPISVGVGDFNGDSDPDLAVANLVSDNVSILLGDGSGSFAGPTDFAVGSFPDSVAVGDFNGDSDPDLAVANALSPPATVSILLGAAGGSFTGPTDFAVGSSPHSVTVGDFNRDSDPDLAVANDNVSILLGDGSGSFTGLTDFAAGSSPSSVAVGDFNGDGLPDLAVANENSDNVSILLNTTVVNRPPDCSTVAASPNTLWPPNHRFRLVKLSGATDPDGDPVALTISGVTQDEPVNGKSDGNTSPDAKRASVGDQVFLRAERSAQGSGRVYRIAITASDGKGGSCEGTATVAVPHDQGKPAVDSAPPSYNSFGP